MYVTVVWVEERSHGAGFGSEFYILSLHKIRSMTASSNTCTGTDQFPNQRERFAARSDARCALTSRRTRAYGITRAYTAVVVVCSFSNGVVVAVIYSANCNCASNECTQRN